MHIRQNGVVSQIKGFFRLILSYLNKPFRVFPFRVSRNRFLLERQSVKRKRSKIIISNYDDLRNPWYAGGGAIAIHEVAKRLAEVYSVEVFVGLYPSARKEEFIDGVHYRRIGTRLFGPRLGQLAYWIKLPFYAVSLDFDVWIDSFTPPFGVSVLPLILSGPVVGLIHMLPGMDMWRKYRLPFFLFERIGLSWYSRFIVLTDVMRSKIRKCNEDASIWVIPNGVDIPDLSSDYKKEHLLFIGRIEMNQKGLDLLLDAYASAYEDIGRPLVIAGSGLDHDITALKNHIKTLPCSDKIEFKGRVIGEEKSILFEKAFSVIIPSRFETFSIVALEALSYGIPAVAFNIPGLSTFSPDYVFRATPFSAESLAREMLRSVSVERLPEYYRQEARKFDWNTRVATYRSVIEDCLR